MKEKPFLSVVVPAYNEEKRIGKAITAISNYFDQRDCRHEIIVVNDGGSDTTEDIVREKMKKSKNLRLISLKKNQWKGGAVRAGALAVKGKFVLISDADLATPIEEFEKLFQKIEEGYEIVVASRGLRESRILSGSPFLRSFLAKLFGQLTRLLVVKGVKDPQCGFKLFTQKVARTIFSNEISSTPLWDIDVLVHAAKRGFRVSEVPVTWCHNPDSRLTYNLERSIKIFLELLHIKVKHRIVFPVLVNI